MAGRPRASLRLAEMILRLNDLESSTQRLVLLQRRDAETQRKGIRTEINVKRFAYLLNDIATAVNCIRHASSMKRSNSIETVTIVSNFIVKKDKPHPYV